MSEMVHEDGEVVVVALEIGLGRCWPVVSI